MSPVRTSLLLLAVAGLAGCEQPEDRQPANALEPVDPPTKSIIREDVRPVPIEDAVEVPLAMTVTLGDEEELTEDMRTSLENFLGVERLSGDGEITLFGHSDSSGSEEDNDRASLERARLVAAYLVELGVSVDRINIVPLGEHNPVLPNRKLDGTDNEAGQRANRRVEVVLGSVETIMERRAGEVSENSEADAPAAQEAASVPGAGPAD